MGISQTPQAIVPAAFTSGGMTVLASGSFSTSTGTLTFSSISTDYKDLIFVARNFRLATDNTYPYLRVNNVSSAVYNYSRVSSPSTSVGNNVSTNQFLLSSQLENWSNGAYNNSIVFEFLDYAHSTSWKLITGNIFYRGTSSLQSTRFDGAYEQTTAITRIDLISNSGNFATGDYILYGVK